MIAGILLMLVIPLARAGGVYIMLRWRLLAGLLSAATALLLALMVVTLPVDQPVLVWGDQPAFPPPLPPLPPLQAAPDPVPPIPTRTGFEARR